MKIKDVVIKEGGSGGAAQAQKKAAQQQAATAPTLDDGGGYDAMGNPTSSMPSASPTNVAAPPKGAAGQGKWPTSDAEIRAFQQANGLKVDGMIGGKTMAALQKSGATPPAGFKPVGPKTAAPKKADGKEPGFQRPPPGVVFNNDPNQAAVDASNAANQQAVQQQKQNYAQADAANAPDRFAGQAKTDAQTGQNNLGVADTQGQANTDIQDLARLAGTMRKTPPPQANALGVQQQANVANPFAPAPQADKPNPPTAQADPSDGLDVPHSGVPTPPAPNQAAQPASQVSADTGLSTVPGEVKSGTGGKTNITTASQDEYAWRAKNPNWNMMGKQYPGAGNWDPSTGRSKKDIEQGQKNLDFLKGMFGGNKQAPAAPAAPAPGQGAQPAKGPAAPGGYGRFYEETSILRKLAGLE